MYHVAVTDRFHLVDVVAAEDVVETRVDHMEELHHHQRIAPVHEIHEARQVAEEDGHFVERFRLDRLATTQQLNGGPKWKDKTN